MANREQVGLDVGPALTTRLGSAACQILHRRGEETCHTRHSFSYCSSPCGLFSRSVLPRRDGLSICTVAAPCSRETMSPSRATSFLLAGSRPAISCKDFPSARRSKDVEGDDFPFGGVRAGYWFDDTIPYLGVGVDINPFFLHTPAQRVRTDSNASIEVEIDDDRFVIEGGQNLPAQLPPIGQITAIFSFDAMARYFLHQSTAFPQGRLQPYLTLGPALLLTDEDPEVNLGVKVGDRTAVAFHRAARPLRRISLYAL